MAKLDPELLAKMPKPPADFVPLKPPEQSLEQQQRISDAIKRLMDPNEEDDDDGMTDAEVEQMLRDMG